MEPDKLKQIVEAALLAADEPLTIDKLAKLFRRGEVDGGTIRADLREALTALDAESAGRGFELKRVASGFRYQVRQELSPYVSRLWDEKPPRYTRALMETLALVAYKQPVTRGDIEQVRGVSISQNIMRTLLERGWIRVVGQREVPGKPAMYGTTRLFLDYFNLKSLDQLPPLAEIRELIEPLVVEEVSTGADEKTAQLTSVVPVIEAEDQEMGQIEDVGQAEDASQAETSIDSEAFGAELAAAFESADAITARIAADRERPQVVDVITDAVDEVEAGDAESDPDSEPESEQPSAEVVRLPTAPH
jgi:segregation and condensation protein B